MKKLGRLLLLEGVIPRCALLEVVDVEVKMSTKITLHHFNYFLEGKESNQQIWGACDFLHIDQNREG
ncbi:unnamed protein product [Lactuca virosa]|uniref:Uncharacterized protein n=1 Tax=Lactuca virosa TaxID=75947 RepID=A0AAU9N8E9_9ASTR|nr:unnamed protein product [Lactuca virosa]